MSIRFPASIIRCALAALLLAGCDGKVAATGGDAAHHRQPEKWTIGPVIGGHNYSPGMPLHPSRSGRGGMQIELPHAPGSVHYVTFRHGSLAGKSRIAMRYRVEADPGVRIVPTTVPGAPSVITLYFQRSGDTWSGRRRYETYRWYATFASQWNIKPGEHVIVAPLNGAWTAVETSTAATDPSAFREAVAEADQVGFVLGGGDGYGHGVHIEGKGGARLIVTDFRVE
jgi:hypothetical protein